jgi:hypothetical protein
MQKLVSDDTANPAAKEARTVAAEASRTRTHNLKVEHDNQGSPCEKMNVEIVIWGGQAHTRARLILDEAF